MGALVTLSAIAGLFVYLLWAATAAQSFTKIDQKLKTTATNAKCSAEQAQNLGAFDRVDISDLVSRIGLGK